jgi:hypothetical protein
VSFAQKALARETVQWCTEQFLRVDVVAGKPAKTVVIGIDENAPNVLMGLYNRLTALLQLDQQLKEKLDEYRSWVRSAAEFDKEAQVANLMDQEVAIDPNVTRADVLDILNDQIASINLCLEYKFKDTLQVIKEWARDDRDLVLFEILRKWLSYEAWSAHKGGFEEIAETSQDWEFVGALMETQYTDDWTEWALAQPLTLADAAYIIPWFPPSDIVGRWPVEEVLYQVFHTAMDVLAARKKQNAVHTWKVSYTNGIIVLSDPRGVRNSIRAAILTTWEDLVEWAFKQANALTEA